MTITQEIIDLVFEETGQRYEHTQLEILDQDRPDTLIAAHYGKEEHDFALPTEDIEAMLDIAFDYYLWFWTGQDQVTVVEVLDA